MSLEAGSEGDTSVSPHRLHLQERLAQRQMQAPVDAHAQALTVCVRAQPRVRCPGLLA